MIDIVIKRPIVTEIISFTDEEWEFIKKDIIEDALSFHSATFQEFGVFAKDLADDEFDPEKSESNFKKHKSALEKLKSLGVNIFDLNKI